MDKTLGKNRSGFTLIEIMVAIIVIVVGVLGAMMYRYHTAINARKADVKIASARIGLMLLEGWNGMGGNLYSDPNNTYDPVGQFSSTELTIRAGTGPGGLTDEFGSYRIEAKGVRVNYFATLSSQDVTDQPRVLNVHIAWSHNYGADSLPGEYRSTKLTTYVDNR